MPRVVSRFDHADIESMLEYNRGVHADVRRLIGDPMVSLEVAWSRLLCVGCYAAGIDNIFRTYRHPDIDSESWDADEESCEDELRGHAWKCSGCGGKLQARDEFYIEDSEPLTLDEREVENIEPSRKTRNAVRRLYAHTCFRCGIATGKIDHIEPRRAGGKGGFGNLQLLCGKCGNLKKDTLPRRSVRAIV